MRYGIKMHRFTNFEEENCVMIKYDSVNIFNHILTSLFFVPRLGYPVFG